MLCIYRVSQYICMHPQCLLVATIKNNFDNPNQTAESFWRDSLDQSTNIFQQGYRDLQNQCSQRRIQTINKSNALTRVKRIKKRKLKDIKIHSMENNESSNQKKGSCKQLQSRRDQKK